MPTYDYECKACGHTFDELQSFSEPPLTKCPACRKNKLERLFGGGGAIIFKGSGFYETDYRRAGAAKANGKADGDAPKAETKPEGKAESPSTSGSSEAAPEPAGKKETSGKTEGKGSSKKTK